MKTKEYKIPWFTQSLCIAILGLICTLSQASGWTVLAPGIEYRDEANPTLTTWAHIHVFRIDLKHNDLKIIPTKSPSFVDELIDKNASGILINGGFFDEHNRPLGLRIQKGAIISPLKSITWWGVFYIRNNLPYLTSMKQFVPSKDIDFAIQSGPRLIISGRIPPLKPGWAERTALGIDHKKHVIIVITENNPLTTRNLALIMRNSPLNCYYALNLDGGSSTQLFANLGSFYKNIRGFSKISDAVGVYPH